MSILCCVILVCGVVGGGVLRPSLIVCVYGLRFVFMPTPPNITHLLTITNVTPQPNQGPRGKMSASVETSAIYVTDTLKKIKTKIGRAFSGGQVRPFFFRFGVWGLCLEGLGVWGWWGGRTGSGDVSRRVVHRLLCVFLASFLLLWV